MGMVSHEVHGSIDPSHYQRTAKCGGINHLGVGRSKFAP
jgi:hypothetical protein